jgi:nucleoside-diphosphate-sugar epimerase
MKVLVTGGTGFIGSRLALAAQAQGREVLVTGQTRTPAEHARLAELAAAGVRTVCGDLKDPDFAASLVGRDDLVIHLAAAQHEANVPDSYFTEVNVGATGVLLDASRRAGACRFVYGSTIGVYGSAANGTLDERSAPNPDNIYGRTKLAAEQRVRAAGADLETCIVRISETYGPGDLRLLLLFRAIDRRAFVMIGSGENRRQVIHVDDLARGLLLAAEHPAACGEIFVLAGHEIMTTRSMVAGIAQALDRAPPRWRVPLWPFVAAAALFESTLKPMGVQPPLHRRRLDFFRKSFLFSTAKAGALLGFAPATAFAAGAAQTAHWYRARGYLG